MSSAFGCTLTDLLGTVGSELKNSVQDEKKLAQIKQMMIDIKAAASEPAKKV